MVTGVNMNNKKKLIGEENEANASEG